MKVLATIGKVFVSILSIPFTIVGGVLFGLILIPLYIIDCIWSA